MQKIQSANVVKPLISTRKVVQAGNVVVLDEKNRHIRDNRDGTVIKLDVNNGVYTMDVCVLMRLVQFPARTKCSRGGEESHGGCDDRRRRRRSWMRRRSRNSRLESDNRPKKHTYCKREGRTRSNTHDWCIHCMRGRGRTHHHVSNKRSEDLIRRPIIAIDSDFLKPNSTANSQPIPDEPVTCIAVTEDRHQNSVVLKKGIEEPWASERVARFINSLGYKGIT